MVAVSRAEANEVNMIITPWLSSEPDLRVRAIINAGAVPIGKSRCLSARVWRADIVDAAISAEDW
jgi:hypothetical protein